MYLRYRQNDTVSTQTLLKPTDNIFPSPFLPVELIVDILLRLPAKYLLQFRCVCKLWKTLISKIQFANKRLAFCDHTTNHYSSYPLKSLFENPSPRVLPDSFSGLEIDDYYILGSCNGFFCVYDTDQCNIIMYNPSTGFKSKRSPKISSPDWSMPYNGFGYDQVNDKYKVLAVVEHDDGDSDDEDFGESFTKIYTFGEDSWRTVEDFPHTPTQGVGNYVSGTLNWFNDIWYKWHEQYLVHSFDLEKETFRELLLPFIGNDCMCRPSLCVLNDRLCVCFVNKTHLVVWLMKEYGVVESWTKLMTIPREKLVFLNSTDRCSTIDLLFISNGVALLMVSSQLILYNLNSGELDHPLISINGVLDPQIYCENLISPRCKGHVRLVDETMSFVREFNIANPSSKGRVSLPLSVVMPSVSGPSFLVYVDARCNLNGPTVWGLLIKNHDRITTFSASKCDDIAVDPVMAEALGVCWEIQLVREQGLHFVTRLQPLRW